MYVLFGIVLVTAILSVYETVLVVIHHDRITGVDLLLMVSTFMMLLFYNFYLKSRKEVELISNKLKVSEDIYMTKIKDLTDKYNDYKDTVNNLEQSVFQLIDLVKSYEQQEEYLFEIIESNNAFIYELASYIDQEYYELDKVRDKINALDNNIFESIINLKKAITGIDINYDKLEIEFNEIYKMIEGIKLVQKETNNKQLEQLVKLLESDLNNIEKQLNNIISNIENNISDEHNKLIQTINALDLLYKPIVSETIQIVDELTLANRHIKQKANLISQNIKIGDKNEQKE